MFLEILTPQELIDVTAIKEISVVGLLLLFAYLSYRDNKSLKEKLEKKNEQYSTKIDELREEFYENLSEIRKRYDDEIREIRKDQSVMIEKLTTIISDNTRMLSEVNITLRTYEKRHNN